MDSPDVTVIVCTRNRAEYLRACLASLARQDCDAPFEVLVVDNGSTDGTARLLSDWCRADSRFRAVEEARTGLSIAKNTGVRLARGRLLLFTDDDVIVDPGWVRAYAGFFAHPPGPFVIAGGPIVPVPHDLGPWPSWLPAAARRDTGLLDHGEPRALGRAEYVWGANMAIPAGHFGRTGPWNEAVGRQGERRGTFEDTEYQDRFTGLGGAVWFCPAATLQHRIPRDTILPATVLRTAFARARNEFWQEVLVRRDEGTFQARTDYVTSLAALSRRLVAFAFWSLAFTWGRSETLFARAYAAAESSGRAVDVLRAGRESTRTSVAIGRVAFLVLDTVLSMVRAATERGGWASSQIALPPPASAATRRAVRSSR